MTDCPASSRKIARRAFYFDVRTARYTDRPSAYTVTVGVPVVRLVGETAPGVRYGVTALDPEAFLEW